MPRDAAVVVGLSSRALITDLARRLGHADLGVSEELGYKRIANVVAYGMLSGTGGCWVVLATGTLLDAGRRWFGAGYMAQVYQRAIQVDGWLAVQLYIAVGNDVLLGERGGQQAGGGSKEERSRFEEHFERF